jgi:predicted phosphodiesterase
VLLAGVAGAAVVAVAVFPRNRRAIEIAVTAAVVSLAGSGAIAAATYKPEAFLSPTFSGPLTIAPQLIGPVRAATQRLDYFREELHRVVEGIVRVYTSVSTGPLPAQNEVRILHISDIHLSPLGFEFAQELARGFDVDAVIDTGDATSFGTPAENLITRFIPDFGVPYVFVRGNHDSRGLQAEIARIPNAVVLDGDAAEVAGLEIYGLGHPVFLKNRAFPTDVEAFAEEAHAAGEQALEDVEQLERAPDIVAVHDERMAETLAGRIPLVLSGHFHEEKAEVRDGTLYLRVATTGGAGLETFLREGGIPLSAEILYFEAGPDPALVAYDTVRQFPESGDLTIERTLVPEGEVEPAEPTASP